MRGPAGNGGELRSRYIYIEREREGGGRQSEVNVEERRRLNGKKDEARRSAVAIRFRATKPTTTAQVWLKVGRNFLMYVGESVGRWLAFVL